MKFKIDENLPHEFAGTLRKAGHDAVTVVDEGLGGQEDGRILSACQREGRALITLDLDFSDIRLSSRGSIPGVVIFRVRRQDRPALIALLRRILPMFDREPLENRIWIIEESRVRIRGEEG